MSWRPATREEMLAALAAEKADLDPDFLAEFDGYWVEPCAALVRRSGEDEPVFIVARSASRIIFYEDVEESFCLAREAGGRLTEVMDFGHLGPALKEMRRMEQI